MITLGFNQKPVHARRARPRIDLFMRMCENIALFMQENDGRDFKAFLVRDHGFISLYLMTTAKTYDFELSRKLTEFSGPYIKRGVFESVSLLPASSFEELEAFFDPKRALQIKIEDA